MCPTFFFHEWEVEVLICMFSMCNSTVQVQDILEAAKVLEWLKENCTIEYVRR
jgi:hypothetical protein